MKFVIITYKKNFLKYPSQVTKAPKLRCCDDKKMARCAVIVRLPYGDAVRRYYSCRV